MQSAIYGNFSGPKAQEIIVSRGKVLELLRPDENGKMQTICSTEVFGKIRAIMPFRLTDVGRTYIVMGSDSGRIVILEYSKVSLHSLCMQIGIHLDANREGHPPSGHCTN